MVHPSRLVTILASVLVLGGCGSDASPDEDASDVTEEEATVIDVVEDGPCTSDGDCDNGIFCDGEETCDSGGECQPGTAVDCDDSDPCTMDSCDDDLGDCVFETLDADGDGYYAEEAPTGESCGGTDCDDDADDIHPDAPDAGCDLIDKDCDEVNFEGIDDDEDGWIDAICDGLMSDHTGYEGFGDCDDDGDHMPDDPPDTIYPGAPEGCDATIDHDCDGDSTEVDTDFDGDGFPPESCVEEGETFDCDDTDDTIYPGAPTTCDDVDDDCSGYWWDETDADDDGDHYLDIDCGGDDCDDTDSAINPAGTVDCSTTDHDCNTHPDNDQDGDGYERGATVTGYPWPDCGGDDCDDSLDTYHPGATLSCDTEDHDCNTFPDQDNDDDGYIRDSCSGGTDCNDADASTYPGATPDCTTDDHDCNSRPDNDQDGDGYIRQSIEGSWPACGGTDCDDHDATSNPAGTVDCTTTDHDCNTHPDNDQDGDGYVRETAIGAWPACSGGDDCDDVDGAIHPGATVDCTTTDHDCNGQPDNDQDGDGIIRGATVSGWPGCGGGDCDDSDATILPGGTVDCTTTDHDCNTHPDNDQDGDGYVRETAIGAWPACSGGTDCDDDDDTSHPGGTVDCSTTDHDCDGDPDNDQDGDGYTRGASVSGWTGCGGPDCNDADAAISPLGTVDCTTTDHDCNTHPDNDQDGDGFVRENSVSGWPACGGTDCDDDDATTNPSGTVDCSTTDHDCNTHPDNDQDGDGGIRESVTGSWPACGGNDCDDTSASIYWGATELCDTIDQDCDGDIVEGPGADDDGDGYLDITCGGPDCDDTTDRYHPTPPAVDPDVCWEDDYDCNSSLDLLGTVASVDIDVERGSAAEPAVAWSGTEYGVVWAEDDVTASDREIYFTRMDASGVEVGSPITLTNDTANYYRPDIAWSGAKWGVVFQDDDSNVNYFMTMDPDGSGASTPVLVTALCDTWEQWPRVAGDGTGFGIVWQCRHSGVVSIYFDTGTAGGALGLGSPVNLVDNGSIYAWLPDIAWHTSRYGVVWSSRSGTGDDDIVIDIVDTSGGDLAGGEVNVSNVPASEDARYPCIEAGTVNLGAGDVAGFGMAWNRSTNLIYGAVASLADPPLHSTPVRLSSAEVASPKYPAVAWIADGDSFGVAWEDQRAGSDVYLMQMGVDGTTTGYTEVIISDVDPAYNPGLAWHAGYLGVAWDNGTGDVLFSQPLCTY